MAFQVELEGNVGALHLLLPPPLLGTLQGLLGALDPPGESPPNHTTPGGGTPNPGGG